MTPETEPIIVQKRAIDVTPGNHGIWCSVKGMRHPFTNRITSRSWSETGEKIWFMLDTFNFQDAKPDDVIDVVEMIGGVPAKDAAFMAGRPAPLTREQLAVIDALRKMGQQEQARVISIARSSR